ncbi:MAG: GTP cyclohydrolase 1 [Syntrophomonadaceae bacterium]|nr:GTP cyclohydrolase 1 [Bacillota bacterium]
MKKFFSLSDTYQAVGNLAEQIKNQKKQYDVIYGVPRGGVPVAMLLSQVMGIPFVPFIPYLEKQKDVKVLVVDDVIDSGKTRRRFAEYDFACLFQKFSTTEATYYAERTKEWIVFWWEGEESASIEDSVTRQLQFFGEDITRDGLLETPKRVVQSWKELYSGYEKNPADVFKIFDMPGYSEMILLKDIEFYSMCEHHLLPFVGKAHIAYIPGQKVVGISKLARLLEVYSRRLQIQERLCRQITNDLVKYLEPVGAACIIEAQHFCMRMRGVQKQNSVMTTSSLTGAFLESQARQELMSLIGRET